MKSETAAEQRKEYLAKLILEKQQALETAPEGRLRIDVRNGAGQYYHVLSEENHLGQYLRKDQLHLIRQLAQKSYDERVLKALEQEKRAMERFEQTLPQVTAEAVYETLSAARKELVTPIRLTDEEYRRNWESEEYEPGWFKRDDPTEFYTEKGERVRSKSEIQEANLLNKLDIPYRYEYPLDLRVGHQLTTFRPDFLLLDVKNRKEYILEHFGKMDDKEYARQTFQKLRIYDENGYNERTNLICVFEMSDFPLSVPYLEQRLRQILDL